MTPRVPRRPRAFAPDPDAPGRTCDMPGCGAVGGYRAPKNRDSVRDYWWFCLEHVRAYNATWDYYKGMTPGQIEAQTRADTGWQRPTWPLGSLGAAHDWEDTLRSDPMLHQAGLRAARTAAAASVAPTELRAPLATLGIAWPTTMEAVKHRYKELAKRHHPDANGGDRASEERLKDINLAYAAIRSHYAHENPRRAPENRAAAGG